MCPNILLLKDQYVKKCFLSSLIAALERNLSSYNDPLIIICWDTYQPSPGPDEAMAVDEHYYNNYLKNY
jgi:hypothetical protein